MPSEGGDCWTLSREISLCHNMQVLDDYVRCAHTNNHTVREAAHALPLRAGAGLLRALRAHQQPHSARGGVRVRW